MAEKTISLSNLTAYNDKIKATYQAKTDNTLTTTNKTVVGAINENKTQLDNITADLNGYSFSDIPSEEPKVLHLQELENPLPPIITETDKGKILSVKSDGTGFEYIEKPTGGSGSGLIIGETSTTAYRGDRGKIAYDHSQSNHNYTTPEDVANAISSISTFPQESLVMRDVIEGEIFTVGGGITPAPVYGQIVLNKTSISVTEGGSGIFTVALDKAPTNNQMVSLSKTNADVTLSSTTLTFTPSNYATPQTITITVAEDNTDYSNETDTITLTSPNVTTKTVTVSITDNDTAPSNIPVTGVAVSPATATITTIGGTQQLTATIAPADATNKAVTWSSSNTTIAEVDQTGKVTSKANGSATITCTAQDTTNNAKGICNIDVQASVTPPEEGLNPSVTTGLIHMYDFRNSGGTANDKVGGINIPHTGTPIDNGIQTTSNISVANIWDRTKSSTIIVTGAFINTTASTTSLFYLGDNIVRLGKGIREISILKGGQIVNKNTVKVPTFRTFKVIALTIDVTSKYQKLYVDGELICEGSYTSDWSEDTLIMYPNAYSNMLIYEQILTEQQILTVSNEIKIARKFDNISNTDKLIRYIDFTTANNDGISAINETNGIGQITINSGSYTKNSDGIKVNTSSSLTDIAFYGVYKNNFSIALKVKIDANETGVDKFEFYGGIKITTKNNAIFVKNAAGTTATYTVTDTNKFYNIVVTINENNLLSLYVDGVLIGSVNNITYTYATTPYIHASSTIYNKLITYNKALTQAEINMLNNEMGV